jgi:hypothetical protein
VRRSASSSERTRRDRLACRFHGARRRTSEGVRSAKARLARAFRGGRYWARTSDPELVEPAEASDAECLRRVSTRCADTLLTRACCPSRLPCTPSEAPLAAMLRMHHLSTSSRERGAGGEAAAPAPPASSCVVCGQRRHGLRYTVGRQQPDSSPFEGRRLYYLMARKVADLSPRGIHSSHAQAASGSSSSTIETTANG